MQEVCCWLGYKLRVRVWFCSVFVSVLGGTETITTRRVASRDFGLLWVSLDVKQSEGIDNEKKGRAVGSGQLESDSSASRVCRIYYFRILKELTNSGIEMFRDSVSIHFQTTLYGTGRTGTFWNRTLRRLLLDR